MVNESQVNEDTMEYIQQQAEEIRELEKQRNKLAKDQLRLYEGGSTEESLVKWQLNLEEEKDRIYHLLRGYRMIVKANNKREWIPPLSKDSEILNDYGVDYIMGLLESFLNRNIILSNFDLERINKICLDLGNQLTEDIYNDYESMGLDTDEKRKKYPMIVWKVIVNVEAALRRAMDNGERRSLRAIMTITQTDNPNRNINQIPMVSQTKRRLLHPTTWLNG